MARKKERKRVSAKKWREEQRGGSIYLKIPDGIGTFQEKAETYRLDFMPFVAGAGNPRAEEGEEYYERTFFVHQGIGPNQEWHLCSAKTFREPCPVCEFRAKEMANPDGDETLIKALAPKERQLWLVRNLQDDPKQTLLWEISYHLFGKQLRDKLNNADEEDGYDYFADPAEGLTVRVAFAQSDRGKWREAVDIEFRQRKVQYDSDVAEEMPCLDKMLVKTPYEKLKALFLQTDSADDEDEDEDEKPKKKRPVETDDDDDAPPKKPKKDADISVGGTVFYKGNPCEVLKVGGENGEKLMIEDMDGDVVKVTLDDLDEEPPKKEKPKKESKKPEKEEDDDWWDGDEDKDDEPKKETKAKVKSKKKSEEKEEAKDDSDDEDDWDWDDD